MLRMAMIDFDLLLIDAPESVEITSVEQSRSFVDWVSQFFQSDQHVAYLNKLLEKFEDLLVPFLAGIEKCLSIADAGIVRSCLI